jgi:type I restriction enzyme, S subunit
MSYPKNWKKVKFSEIAQRKSKRIDKPHESEYENYVGLEHLDSGELLVKRWGSTKDVKSSMKLFETDDILFARRNTYLRRVSVAKFEGVCSGDIIVIEPILSHIVKGFLPIYMQYEPFENKVVAWSAGAFSKRIKWKQLSDFDVWLPTKEEQQRIVDLIWNIQQNIENIEKVISTTEKLKIGLLNQLLTKGIGHTKFKETELGEIPKEWDVVTLSDIASINMGQSPPSSSYNNDKEGLPFFQGKSDFGDKFPNVTTYTSKPTKISEPNDILFTVRAPVGAKNWNNIKSCIGRGIAAIKPKNGTDPNYLYYLLELLQYEFETLSQGSTFTAINGKELKKFKLSNMPCDEQQKVSSILVKIDSQLQCSILHKEKLSILKKKLTNEFLSYKITLQEATHNV